jgi:hypothetical protein
MSASAASEFRIVCSAPIDLLRCNRIISIVFVISVAAADAAVCTDRRAQTEEVLHVWFSLNASITEFRETIS